MLKDVVSRHLVPVSQIASKKNRFQELQMFKHHIEIESLTTLFRPYSATKSSVWFYRSVFYGFGCLYMILGMMLITKSHTLAPELLFINSSLIKSVLFVLCALSASISLVIGYSMKPEQEAVNHLCRKAKERVKNIYQKKARLGMTQQELEQRYIAAMERLHGHKKEAEVLLNRIAATDSLEETMREELFNQALLELKQKTNELVRTLN